MVIVEDCINILGTIMKHQMEHNIIKRQTNIEALRVLAMLAVIVLHFNFYPGGGGAISNVSGLNRFLLILLECFCISAVNVFLMISGYCNYKKTYIKTERLMSIVVQTCIFQGMMTLIYCMLYRQMDLKMILEAFLPVNYYAILYVSLMLLSPYINYLLRSISNQNNNHVFVIIIFILFSIWPICSDILELTLKHSLEGLNTIGIMGDMKGYNIVNFILAYILGAEIDILELHKRISRLQSVIILFSSVAVIYIWYVISPEYAWSYCNPFVLIEALILVRLFSECKIDNGLINKIATASYTCYLIHIPVLYFFNFEVVKNLNTISLLFVLFLVLSAMVFVSYIITIIWKKVYIVSMKKTFEKLPNIECTDCK